MKLLKWQEKVLNWWYDRGCRGNVWASTGLGKTVLGSYLCEPNSLVTVPSHLVGEWVEGIKTMHPGLPVNVIDKNNKSINEYGVNIISHGRLLRYVKEMDFVTRFELVIIDEAHRLKNWKGSTYKGARKAISNSIRSISFSATFLTKDNLDLFTNAFLQDPTMRRRYLTFQKWSKENVIFETVFNGSKQIVKPDYIRQESLAKQIAPHYEIVTYQTAEVEEPEMILKKVKVPASPALHKRIEAVTNSVLGDVTKLSNEELEQAIKDSSPGKVFKLQALGNMIEIEETIQVNRTESKRKTKTFNMQDKVSAVVSIMEGEHEKGILLYFYQAEKEILLKKIKDAFLFKNRDSIEEFEKSDKKIMIAQYNSMGLGLRVKFASYLIEFSKIYDYGAVIQGRGRLRYVGRPNAYKVFSISVENEAIEAIEKSQKRKQVLIAETLKRETNG